MGANPTNGGINFTLFSAHATKVELCLFDASGQHEIQRLVLPEYTDEVWHGFVEDLPIGTLYGYRVYGPFDPHMGHRFNHHKLLIDPYAKQLSGEFQHSQTHYSYDKNSVQQDLTFNSKDNAPFIPKGVVVKSPLQCLSHLETRRRDTTVYEMHVKGFTKLNDNIEQNLRGTFAGLASDSVINYLSELGITSVELLPVHSFISEPFVEEKGLSNYWGYNSINFFVPQSSYCHSDDVLEFRDCVERFHEAGIEVIIDVVYNHTAEGSELGPTLSFRGIDNKSYYRLSPENNRYYLNYSGCGNTLNVSHPRVLQLITDSLRYWVEVMGVDGFRFDLAPILGRENPHFSKSSQFFTALRQDPVLSRVKLIAEPWDIGDDGYQLGRFPYTWMEWNDRFRDTVRRFWRGDKGMAPEFARRLHGSADLFERRSRRPSSSVNFITSHDGYTLHDLVSYEQRHNHANGEENRDGHSSNFSCNFGVEGETDDEQVNQLRDQQKRNLLATLFIAQGTPMLLAGDELSHSQQGNNNAYCQDNNITWIDWNNCDKALHEFVCKLIALRKQHPLLNRTLYNHGLSHSEKTGLPDISWVNRHGQTMSDEDWHNTERKSFGMLLAETCHQTTDQPALSDIQSDDAIIAIVNAHQSSIDFTLPELSGHWQVLIDTAEHQREQAVVAKGKVTLAGHSLMLLSYTHIQL